MKRFAAIGVVLTLALTGAGPAGAASSGSATVTLAANANAVLQVLDPALTLSPTPTDYDNNFVEAAGAAGLRVRLRSNSSAGVNLLVRCSDATPAIALADFLIRTQTPFGGPGASISTYTAMQSTDQVLWSQGVPQTSFLTVTTDIRIQNIGSYSDAAGGGTTNYTNTLTYTAVAL